MFGRRMNVLAKLPYSIKLLFCLSFLICFLVYIVLSENERIELDAAVAMAPVRTRSAEMVSNFSGYPGSFAQHKEGTVRKRNSEDLVRKVVQGLVDPKSHILSKIVAEKAKMVYDKSLDTKQDDLKALMPMSKIIANVTAMDNSSTESLTVSDSVANVSTSLDESKLKHILLWNPFFMTADYGVGLGTKPFENCPHKCVVTKDKDTLETADAVIVHTFYLPKDVDTATLPKRVSEKQIFVFMLMENPARSTPGLKLLDYADVFNLTFTYLDHPDTDLFTPYGGLVPRDNPEPEAVPSVEFLMKKQEDVVWLVSNCVAPSSRYEYVDELSKHIKISVFGKCGEDICSKGANCNEMMEKDFKFYLAFENGFCKDYITEKAFSALKTSMVPIVLGGGNYTKFLPPKSFIDVRDFQSPKHLANYLAYLSQNPTALRSYLMWKKDYKIMNMQHYKYQSFCNLCDIINRPDYPYKQGFDPVQYWNNAHDCLIEDAERQAVHII